MTSRVRTSAAAVPALLVLTGCSGVQSALDPAGVEAERIRTLFVVMTAGSVVIMAAVIVLALAAIFGGERVRRVLSRQDFIVAGGLAFPVVTLAGLLAYGLIVFAARGAGGEPAERFATVTGEQWWWRIAYQLPDGSRIESANELRIPLNVPVTLALETADVIHSFWAPNLAGKLDMIPGRTNYLTLAATKPGISRGQCAEYCGGAHALMAFDVIAMPQAEFDAWLQAEARPAAASGDPDLEGARLFVAAGCGACHTVRGTAARGTIGPDLTHVGSRRSIAAGTLAASAEAFADWIRHNQHIKPENRMPPFHILEDAELALLARYLDSLE
jgi:cytochrome c oxidase subunit 2